jgi:glycosyltransferase involved in cell wall biosynthesis
LFNKERFIRRALTSVLHQTLLPLEIIIVDDGSTDSGPGIIRDMESPIVRIIRQENQGAGAARNNGIRNSRGSHIALLDADDEWNPDFLSGVRDAIVATGPTKKIGIFAVVIFREKHGTASVEPMPPERFTELPSFFIECGASYPVCSSSVAIPRWIFDEIGFFNTTVRLKEDVDMWIRISLKYPILRINSILATVHNDDPSSITKLGGPREQPIDVESICRHFNCEVDDIPSVPERKYAQDTLYRYCRGMIRYGNLEEFDTHISLSRLSPRRRAVLFLLRTFHWLVPKKGLKTDPA